MKLFDCQEMPEATREEFFDTWPGNKGNDVVLSWEVGDGCSEAVDSWLMENGASDGETVLVKHWW